MAKSKAKAKKKRLKFTGNEGKQWVEKSASSGHSRPSLVVPSGVKMYVPKKGKAKLSIVPYAAGAGNPKAAEGTAAFERTYFVHRVGVKGESHVCLAETFGEKCPVCEDRMKLFRGDADDIEAAKALRPKARQLWNVYDHDDPKSGVQLMELSEFAFGRLLQEVCEDDDDAANFADPDNGKILQIKWKEESFGGGSFVSAANINFVDRSALADKILEAAVCLDDLVKKTEYDALRDIYLQGADDDDDEDDDEDEDEEPTPKKKRGGKKKVVEDDDDEDEDDEDEDDEDEDDEDEDDDDEEDDAEDDDSDEEDDDDLDDDEDDEDDDDDEDEDDEEDDDEDDDDDLEDDEDDDDEPPPKKKGAKKAVKKPAKKPASKGKGRKKK